MEAIINIEEYLLSKNAKFTRIVDRLRGGGKWLENLAKLSKHATITHSVGPTGPTTTVSVNDPLSMLMRDPDAPSSSGVNR